MKAVRRGQSRTKSKPAGSHVRRAKRKPVLPAGVVADESGAVSEALFGIDHGGHARDAAEPSVKESLEDWVEEGANEGDRWLLERGGESVQQPPE